MRDRMIGILIATSLLTNCTVGPNYHRPSVQVPQAFHSAGVRDKKVMNWWFPFFSLPFLQYVIL